MCCISRCALYGCRGDVFQRFCMVTIDRWLSSTLTTVSLTLFVACLKTKFIDCWWSTMQLETRCTFSRSSASSDFSSLVYVRQVNTLPRAFGLSGQDICLPVVGIGN